MVGQLTCFIKWKYNSFRHAYFDCCGFNNMVRYLDLIILDIQERKNTNERPGYLGSKNAFFSKITLFSWNTFKENNMKL